MSRWLLEFDALDPSDPSKTRKTGIPEWLYRKLQRHGHEKSLARIVLVNEVLCGGTARLYRGWNRPDKDNCFVYVGQPSRDFQSLEIELPPKKGMVFLVFVLPNGTIDDWNWRQSKAGGLEPEGVAGELIWPPKQN